MKRVRWSRRSRYYAVVGIFLFLVATIGTLTNPSLSGTERQVFYWFYNLPSILNIPMLVVTQAGSVWALSGLTVGLVLVKRRQLALRVWLSGTAMYIAVLLVKYTVTQPRPALLLANLTERELAIGTYGFPSGHTALATVVGITLVPYLPRRWRWSIPLLIGLVAISRIYIGVHAPWDVIGGLGLGLLGAAIQGCVGNSKLAKKS